MGKRSHKKRDWEADYNDLPSFRRAWQFVNMNMKDFKVAVMKIERRGRRAEAGLGFSRREEHECLGTFYPK